MPKAAVQSRIPQPQTFPWLGNVPSLDTDAPVQSLMRLGQKLGPLYRLQLPSQTMLVVSSHALVDELCDESRFGKFVHASLRNLREVVGDALFTADTSSPAWAKAHRILTPAFGPAAMRRYYDGMLDVAEQMLSKWERLGPDTDLDVGDNMTRLTLDTIALTGFGYRFNSFYQREMHPFVGAMLRALGESGARSRRLPLQSRLMVLTRRQYDRDISLMNDIVDGLMRVRRSDGPDGEAHDLLSLMLAGRDPVTGEGLDDTNIRHQMVTFLIAGHETTSGMLSFAIYLMLRHPAVLKRAIEEVDSVLEDADAAPTFEQISRLSYIDQVLRESLRMWPTAPAFAMSAHEDTTLAGTVPVGAGEPIFVLTPLLHRDPAVWRDPETFDPTRFSRENAPKIPPNAWKAFGTGQRACIGRSFAMLEATLVLALVLRRFDLSEPGGYELVIKESLTLKPDGFYVRARRRARSSSRKLAIVREPVAAPISQTVATQSHAHGTPLLVLFGSNSGSSEDFAQRLVRDATRRGYAARTAPLDEYVGRLPQGPNAGATLIVTASYNGQPPENARRFVTWLEGLAPDALAGLRFAVLGCGHRDWVTTYQAVPRRIDGLLVAAGATRVADRGEADAGGDFFGDFESWSKVTNETVDRAFGAAHALDDAGPRFQIDRVEAERDLLETTYGARSMSVIANRELCDMTSPFGRSKRYLDIELPEGVSYRSGDYLAVFPEHDAAVVARAATRFGLRPDELIVVRPTRSEPSTLPTDTPVTVGRLLARYVELGAPATRGDLRILAAHTPCPPESRRLLALAADDDVYRREILEPRTTVMDLLERFPACEMPFGVFLECLPPLKPRRYSISSSPLRDARRCSLTVAVLDQPARSGNGRHRGTCSTYLAQLEPGATLAASVIAPNAPFHLPDDPTVPIVLACAGSGMAPFRGFLEERAALAREGARLGPALLFCGFDHPDVDYLFRDELAAWQDAGIVEVYPAFSRAEEGGVTFVQHRLWRERVRVAPLLAAARIFVCGDGGAMAPAVKETIVRIRALDGCSDVLARAWVAERERTGQYVADVFAS